MNNWWCYRCGDVRDSEVCSVCGLQGPEEFVIFRMTRGQNTTVTASATVQAPRTPPPPIAPPEYSSPYFGGVIGSPGHPTRFQGARSSLVADFGGAIGNLIAGAFWAVVLGLYFAFWISLVLLVFWAVLHFVF